MSNNIKHTVRLAQQQALASFAELVSQMLVDTNVLVGAAFRQATAGEQTALNGARYWLNEQDRPFRQLIQVKYTALLERAMETMHTDLRAGMHDIRADMLSLVEDDVMTRQIELDRLVTRLRDVDELSLGRINLTIASLHGVSKVRERENPFRPYLAARALYESVRETARDGAVAKVLFEHMAGAMANLLPGYYATVLGHFEARGLDARLLAQPSDMTRAQRERMNTHYGLGTPNQVQGLQELVWKVLDERAAPDPNGLPRIMSDTPAAPNRAQAPQNFRLDSQLKMLQQARGPGDGAGAGETGVSPLSLSEQLGDKADPHSRVTIDLAGLVFDTIGRDTLLPPDMRALLGRLHIPFLRAAVLDPELLQQASHPARSLLNRLGALSAALPHDPMQMPALRAELTRLVDHVRRNFDADVQVFAAAETELDTIVAGMLRQPQTVYGRLGDAVEAADSNGALFAAMQKTLKPLLLPLELDPRLSAFIDTVWSKVMLLQGGGVMDATLLPELIWSAQEKLAPADRNVLMRSLPNLVRRIREGIALLGLPAAESQAALDQLVAVHMDVLGGRVAPGGRSTSLDWLHVHFAPLSSTNAATVTPAGAALAPAAELEAALTSHGLPAVVHAGPDWRDAQPTDAQWLLQTRPGARFEALVDGSFVPMRLETVAQDQSSFIFSAPAPALPQVYRKNALLAALQGGTLRPVEYAPLFERAVSSAMAGLTPRGPDSVLG